MGRTKEEKAEYDRKRKANAIKERRFTKPFKIFMERKYVNQYREFVRFYNEMENKYPNKRDLTKTELFKDFLKEYPAEITDCKPVVPVETTAPVVPAETTVEITAPVVPAETTVETTAPVVPAETTV